MPYQKLRLPVRVSYLLALLLLLPQLLCEAWAQIPQIISYQGKLVVSGTNFHGTGRFKFALVGTNAAGATVSFWTNDGTAPSGAEPSNAVSLPVNDGLYSVLLGDATLPNMRIIPGTVFANSDVRLRIWFSPDASALEQLTPDQRIAAVGYAMMAGTAATVADGAITAAKLAGGSVTAEKLAVGAVSADKIADGSVSNAKLADGSVQSRNIAAGAVGAEQLARLYDAGRLGSSDIPASLDPDGSLSVTTPYHFGFAKLPIVTLAVEDSTLSGAAPQITLLSKTTTNFTIRITQIEPNLSTVAANVPPAPLSFDSNAGSCNSLAVVNGHMAVCFFDATKKTLLYARATDALGTLWPRPIVVDPATYGITATRFLVVSGYPAIFYCMTLPSGETGLYYVRAQDVDGNTWSAPRTIVSSDVATRFGVAIVNGNPAASYASPTSGALRLLRALDATGTTWGTPVTILTSNASHPSLQVVQGFPAIAYCDTTDYVSLKYIRATDANGAVWGAPLNLDNGRGVRISYTGSRFWTNNPGYYQSGLYPSLAVIAGRPAISYQAKITISSMPSQLRYTRALNAEGTSWPIPRPLVEGDNSTTDYGRRTGSHTQLLSLNDLPYVFYRYVKLPAPGANSSATEEYLAAMTALDADGNSLQHYTYWVFSVNAESTDFSAAVLGTTPGCAWFHNNQLKFKTTTLNNGDWPDAFTTVSVPSLPVVGVMGQTTASDGIPLATYYDSAKGDLKAVRASNASATAWSAAPISIDTGGNAGLMTSTVLGPAGLTVAYRDEGRHTLKVIRHDGTRWALPTTLTSASDNGTHPSIAGIRDTLGLAFIDAGRNLRFAFAANPEGSQWNTFRTIDVTLDTGIPPSLAAISNSVGIAYSAAALKFYCSSKLAGTPVTVRKTPPGRVSLAMVNGRPAIAFFEAGLFYVRADDPDGLSWPTPIKLDTSSLAGQFLSLRVIAGVPVVAYYNANQATLKFTRADNANGDSWGTPVTIDAQPDAGRYASLVNAGEIPAVVYWAQGAAAGLKLIKANDEKGASWSAPIVLDGTGVVGEYASAAYDGAKIWAAYWDRTNGALKVAQDDRSSVLLDGGSNVGLFQSLTMINGSPAVSYYDADSKDLKFVRAANGAGTSWSVARFVDQTGDVGLYSSLAQVNGFPAIAYYDSGNGWLKFVRSTSTTGTTWAAPVVVDSSADVGQFASLTVVNGNPAIAYYDASNGNLKYVRANDASGITWGTPVSPDPGDLGQDVGKFASLAVVNGRPAISYYDARFGELKFVAATDATGAAWGRFVALDKVDEVGLYTSLRVVAGKPVVAYYNQTANHLRLLRASDVSGTTWVSPQVIDAGPGVGRHAQLSEVSSNASVLYYDETNRRIRSYYPLKSFQINWFAVQP